MAYKKEKWLDWWVHEVDEARHRQPCGCIARAQALVRQQGKRDEGARAKRAEALVKSRLPFAIIKS
jgi:hypothetical protein